MMGDWFFLSSHYLEDRKVATEDIPEWVDKAKSRDAIASTGRSITALLQQHVLPIFDDSNAAEPGADQPTP